MQHNAKDWTGQRFGCLTAIQRTSGAQTKDRSKDRRATWLFRCDCGLEVEKIAGEIARQARRGGYPSAGPCGRQVQSDTKKTHGMSKHPAYIAWRNARQRCELPTSHAWHNYGGRGIRVCERWQDFGAFWADMGPTWAPGLTLDRKDNDGHYEPGNCRWVSMETQANNRRGSLPVNMARLSRETGIGQTTLLYRWHRNLSMTCSTPDPDRASWSEAIQAHSSSTTATT